MNKRKRIIIVLLLVVVCLTILKIIFGEKVQIGKLGYLMQRNSDNQNIDKVGNIELSPTTVVGENEKIRLPNIDDQSLYVLEYKWNISQINIPSKIHVYGVEDKKINKDILKSFVNYFGFPEQPINNDAHIIAYANDAKGATLYLNKQDLFVNYYLDLIKIPIKPGETRLSEVDIKNRLIEMVNKLVDLPEGMSLEVTRIERQKIEEVEYEHAKDNNARVVYLEMRYKLNNYPVVTNVGAPIAARFFDDGTLLKLSINLPFSTNSKVRLLSTKTINQIKQLTGDQFKIISIEGSLVEDVYSETEIVIETVSINNGFIGYVYEAGNPDLQPYVIFEASGKYKNKSVNLLVGVPALQDNLYK